MVCAADSIEVGAGEAGSARKIASARCLRAVIGGNEPDFFVPPSCIDGSISTKEQKKKEQSAPIHFVIGVTGEEAISFGGV